MLSLWVMVLGLLGLVAGEGALLLTSKTLENNLVAQGQDIVVKYVIYNIGNEAAKDVSLVENNFHSQYFAIQGLTSAKWNQIGAGENATHVLVVVPNFSGYFNFTPALVSYTTGGEIEETLTSSPGVLGVVSEGDYYRQFDPHYLDWLLFLALLAVPIGLPYYRWSTSVATNKPKTT